MYLRGNFFWIGIILEYCKKVTVHTNSNIPTLESSEVQDSIGSESLHQTEIAMLKAMETTDLNVEYENENSHEITEFI